MISVAEYEAAERDLQLRESRLGWRIHAAVYALVMTGLTVLNIILVARTDDDFYWFFFPLACWGFGLTMHYVFGVRRAEAVIRGRQEEVERLAERAQATT